MAQYVDGFVIPVPKKNMKKYRAIAAQAAKLWIKYGALEYRETVLEDPRARGCLAFPALAKANPTETVVFSWIAYKSRKHRDSVLKKLFADPWMKQMEAESNPFDVRRMAYGGFTTLVYKQ